MNNTFPAAWRHVDKDRFPFPYEGQFWFIAVEGFSCPQIQGPFPDEPSATKAWYDFWAWQSHMEAG
jgi:hypothetical protein